MLVQHSVTSSASMPAFVDDDHVADRDSRRLDPVAYVLLDRSPSPPPPPPIDLDSRPQFTNDLHTTKHLEALLKPTPCRRLPIAVQP